MLDLKDYNDNKLNHFLDPSMPKQEPLFDEFTIRQLTQWPNQNSWMPYGWKTQLHDA